MRTTKKEAVNVCLRMSKDINDMLEQHCEDSGQTKTAAIERALKMYIADYRQRMGEYEKNRIQNHFSDEQ